VCIVRIVTLSSSFLLWIKHTPLPLHLSALSRSHTHTKTCNPIIRTTLRSHSNIPTPFSHPNSISLTVPTQVLKKLSLQHLLVHMLPVVTSLKIALEKHNSHLQVRAGTGSAKLSYSVGLSIFLTFSQSLSLFLSLFASIFLSINSCFSSFSPLFPLLILPIPPLSVHSWITW
jgi:hypothetical protein